MEFSMKRSWKRVISFVLAFAMAFSFTPVTTSRAADIVSVTVNATPAAEYTADQYVYGSAASFVWNLTVDGIAKADLDAAGVANTDFEIVSSNAGVWSLTANNTLTFNKAESTNAGTYTAVVRFNKSYAGTGTAYTGQTATISVTIAKQQIKYTAKSGAKVMFPAGVTKDDLVTVQAGNPAGATVNDVTVQVAGYDVNVLPQEAGTYNVSFGNGLAENGNYELVPNTAADATTGYTIDKNDKLVTITPPLLTMTYDGNVPSVTMVAGTHNEKAIKVNDIAIDATDTAKNDIVVTRADGAPTLTLSSADVAVEFPNNTPTGNVGKYNVALSNVKVNLGNDRVVDLEKNFSNANVVKGKLTIDNKFVSAAMSNVVLTTAGGNNSFADAYKQNLNYKGDAGADAKGYSIVYGTALPSVNLGNGEGTVSYYVASYDAENDKFDVPADESTIEYSLTSLPTSLEAGIYRVFYKVNPSSNYKVAETPAAGAAVEQVLEAYSKGAPGNYYVLVTPNQTSGNEKITLDGWTYGEIANTPDVSQLDPSENVNKTTDVTYKYYTDYVNKTPAVKGDDTKTQVPSLAGTYTVEATIDYKNHKDAVVYKTFTIAPKKVKLFVEQPITLANGQDVDLASVKVSVQDENATSYSALASDSALVGNDTIEDNFAYTLKYDKASDSVDFKKDNELGQNESKLAVKTANYEIAGTSKGSVTRSTVDLATADVNDGVGDPWGTSKLIEGVETPTFRYSVRGVNDEEFVLSAGGALLVQGTDYDVTYQTYSGDALYEGDPDEALLGGTNLDEVIETGTYAAIFTAKEGSKIVTAGTKKIVTFEVVKAPLYATGIKAVNRVYDGTSVVEITKTGKDANIYEGIYDDDGNLIALSGNPTNVVNINKLILTGTVVDANGNEVVTRSDVDAKVYAQTVGGATVSALGQQGYTPLVVDNASIGLIIPESEAVARNYEIVIPSNREAEDAVPAFDDGNVTTVVIERKDITLDFAKAAVSRPYSVTVGGNNDTTIANNRLADSAVLEFKLAEGVEGNELAAADLKNKDGVERTVADAFATVNIPTKRYAKENATADEQMAVDLISDATDTPIRIEFNKDGAVTQKTDDNTLAGKYNFKFKDNAYTMLSITPVSLSSDAVKVTISKNTYEIADGATTVDASALVETVTLGGHPVSEQTDITFYAALEDGKTANTSAPYSKEKMKALPAGKYVARIINAYGVKNFTDYKDVPFDVTGKKIIVKLTPKEGDAGKLTYNPKSKVVDVTKYNVKYSENSGTLTDVTDLGVLFREKDAFSFELETLAASQIVNGQPVGQTVKGSYDDGTVKADLSQDIPADVALNILTPDFNNKGCAVRFVIDPIIVKKVAEDGVKIETTDVDLTPDVDNDDLVPLAARWTYGEDAVTPTTTGYTNEKDALGNDRAVTYYYKRIGNDLAAAKTLIGTEYGKGYGTVEPVYAGYYAVVAKVAEGTNYSEVYTKAALIKVDKAPLHVYAKADSKVFKEQMVDNQKGGSALYPTYERVEATDLKLDEAKAYAALTKTAAKIKYLDDLLDNKEGITIARDEEVAESKIARNAIETAPVWSYDIVLTANNDEDFKDEGDPLTLSGAKKEVLAETDPFNNYELVFVSAKYDITAIDLAGDNVTSTFVDENGALLDIAGQDKALDKNGKIIADRKGHYPKVRVTVTFGEEGNEYPVELVESEDYTLVYKNEAGSEVTNPINTGKYTIAVTGVDEKTTGVNSNATFTITNSILVFEFVGSEGMTYGDEAYTATINWDNVKILTNGAAKAEAVDAKTLKDIKVALGGEDVTFPIDYTSTDLEAGNAGKHTMKVDITKLEEALGAKYAFDFVLTADDNDVKVPAVNVNIKQKALSTATLEEAAGFDKTNVSYVPGGVTVDEFVKLVDGELLNPEHDYVCKYTANTAVGEATLTFNANDKQNSNYEGTVEYKFTIVKADISKAIIEADSVPYNGAEQSFNWDTAKVYVVTGQDADGNDIKAELKKDVDFTVVADDEAFPGKGTKIGTYPVKIQGKDNFDDTTFAEGVFEITPVELKVTGIVVTNRVYDGTTTLQWAGTAELDKAARDAGWILKSQPKAVVSESKDAGTHDVILEGYELDTTVEANKDRIDQYVIVPYVGEKKLTVEISTKEVKNFTGIKLADKVYDGSKKMNVEGTATLEGVLAGDDLTLTGFAESYEADDPNVGVQSVKIDPTTIVVSGKDAKNYTYIRPELFELTGEITKKPVTVSGLALKEKTYDGTTDAEIEGDAKIDGVIAGETISFEPATKYVTLASADAGEGTFLIKKEDIQAGLVGATKDNYVVAEDVAVTGKINPAEVTIEGEAKLADKPYDGVASMTVADTLTLKGVLPVDEGKVSISYPTSVGIADANAGHKTAKVTVKLGGEKAGNYVLKNTEFDAEGDITPLEISIKKGTLKLKNRYFNTATTLQVTGAPEIEGVDAETAAKILELPEVVEVGRDAGKNKPGEYKVTLKDNDEAKNYTLVGDTITLKGTIAKRKLYVSGLSLKNRVYNKSRVMDITGTVKIDKGLLSADKNDLKVVCNQKKRVVKTATVGTKSAVLGKSFFTLSGAQKDNYQVVKVTLTGKITKATVSKVTVTGTKYTGKAITPTVKAYDKAGLIVAAKYRTTTFYTNKACTKKATTIKAKGTYYVKVTGKSQYQGSVVKAFTVK